jgi:hypothetical protein
VAAWLTAFKFIPWADVIAAAPTVARGAKKLWQSVKDQPPDSKSGTVPGGPESRLEALESQVDDLRKELAASSELISSLAEQNARLVEAVGILRVRTRALLIATTIVFVLLVVVGALMILA